MAALDYITVRGFKSIASIERLPLRRINVLIGANGSGKSNFIEAFSFLHAIRAEQLRAYVQRAGGADEILHFGSKFTEEMTIRISFENELNQYEITLAASDTGELYPKSEYVYYWNKRAFPTPKSQSIHARDGEAGISDPSIRRIGKYVNRHLDRWRLYHFHDTGPASPMKKAADVHDNRLLRPDGSNLAAFLYFLRQQHESSYDLIRRTVRLVAPFLNDFLLEPMSLNENKIRLEWRHVGSDAYFDASSLSDGSLRFIALATLLLQPVSCRPSVILLDEPELGLHPYAIAQLASLVKQASMETQIVIATQSPLLLDHFEPDHVLVADRRGGGTQLTRLESTRLAAWLADYSLGQLWEKNELGGRPGTE